MDREISIPEPIPNSRADLTIRDAQMFREWSLNLGNSHHVATSSLSQHLDFGFEIWDNTGIRSGG
jgi:hypothetical protein